MENKNSSRRDFLKASVKTITAGTIAFSVLDLRKLAAETENSAYSTSPKTINLSDYPELQNVGGNTMIGKVFISKTGENKFIAINTVCTHKKCDVDFTGEGFECPCHGSTYSLSGKVTNGPATKNLKSYKTVYNEADNTLTINM